MNFQNKNIIVPSLIIVLVLIILILGATYAYYKINISYNSVSTQITSTTGSVGSASLILDTKLILKLSLIDMMKKENDITYYATESGVPTTSENNVSIGTAEIEGNVTMDCKYEMNVKVSGTNNMYTAFTKMEERNLGQLVLNVDGTEYDLYETDFPLTINGSITGIKEDSPKDIMASFRIVNKKDIDQTDLSGTDLIFTFSVNNFSCDMVG